MSICSLCKSKSLRDFYTIKKFPIYFGAIPKKSHHKIKKFPLEVSFCNKCNLVQQTNRIDEKYMNQVYSSTYYNCPSPKKSGMGLREIHKFWEFFKSLKQSPKKILEIASFDGYLLGLLKSKGWDIYGCDPAEASKKIAKKKFKNKIKTGFYKKGSYKKNEFDVIVFRNLLEHIYDLNTFLQNVSYSLKSNGHIFIDIPNIKAIVKSGSFGVFFHQHLSYFSKSTIRQVLANNGFKVIKIKEGNPNLFVYAKKVEKTKNQKVLNVDEKFLLENLDKSRNKQKEIMKIFNDKKNKKIILFGMSALATSIINFLPNNLKNKIVMISDNDKEKQGKLLAGFGKLITHPQAIMKTKFDKILICSYFFKKEIVNSLKKYVDNKEKILTI
tara:strand:- start:1606 stop:2757 length:1152 start_codon:yes stop_codon:yes gene_type:complete